MKSNIAHHQPQPFALFSMLIHLFISYYFIFYDYISKRKHNKIICSRLGIKTRSYNMSS
jgi:hypothetical protein